MDIYSTEPHYQHTPPSYQVTNKSILDDLYPAWLKVTCLEKTRQKFDSIVAGLVDAGRRELDKHWTPHGVSALAPCVCSTGGVTVIYSRRPGETPAYPVEDLCEVCITTHAKLR